MMDLFLHKQVQFSRSFDLLFDLQWILYSQLNCTLPQSLRHLSHCVVTKLHILEWPFIVPQHKAHLCNDHAVNELLDMLQPPVRWMDYLGKGEMFTNRNVNCRCSLVAAFRYVPVLYG